MDSPLEYAFISTEIMSIFICVVLLYGNIHETHQKTECGMVYSWMLFTNIIALLFDAMSWILEGNMDCIVHLYISNTVSIVLSLVLLALFAVYISTYVGMRTKTSRALLRAVLIFYSVVTAVTLILCVTGQMFKIENAYFVVLPFYYVYSAFAIISLFISIGFITHHRKALGKHDAIAAYIYIFLPTVCALINLANDAFAFTYQVITISMLVLYVMIQSEHNTKLMEEKEISTYYAEHDELTGLCSRRAYIGKIESVESLNGNVGVIFCDLNGLKYTNDCFGHGAGDKLLVKFADLLRKHFRSEDIFRISGDEFIVMIEQIKAEDFDERVKLFESALDTDGTAIACLGAAFGPGADVSKLIQSAEGLMYERKEEFHKNHPEMRGFR